MIEDSPAFAHSIEGEELAKLLEGVDFAVVAGAPAEVGQKVDERFGFVVSRDVVLRVDGDSFRFGFAFGEFSATGRHDEGQVGHHGGLPTECLV